MLRFIYILDRENYVNKINKYEEVIDNEITKKGNVDNCTLSESKSSVKFQDHISWISEKNSSGDDFLQLQFKTSNNSNNFNNSVSRNLLNREMPPIFRKRSSEEDAEATITGDGSSSTLNDYKSLSFQGYGVTIINDKIKELNQLIEDYRNKTIALENEREQIADVSAILLKLLIYC